jgi:hypothetical protein
MYDRAILINYLFPDPKHAPLIKGIEDITRKFPHHVSFSNRTDLINYLEALNITREKYILHFLGHGQVDLQGNLIGLNYGNGPENTIRWEELADIFGRLNGDNLLVLNFMAVCFSRGLIKHFIDAPFCKKLFGANCQSDSINTSTWIYDFKLNFLDFYAERLKPYDTLQTKYFYREN